MYISKCMINTMKIQEKQYISKAVCIQVLNVCKETNVRKEWVIKVKAKMLVPINKSYCPFCSE